MWKGDFSAFRVLRNMQFGIVFKMGKRDVSAKFKETKIREAIEKAGCSLVYQPPYSPDLNPIEHFWSYLKKKIGALKQKFESIFDAIQYVLAN